MNISGIKCFTMASLRGAAGGVFGEIRWRAVSSLSLCEFLSASVNMKTIVLSNFKVNVVEVSFQWLVNRGQRRVLLAS